MKKAQKGKKIVAPISIKTSTARIISFFRGSTSDAPLVLRSCRLVFQHAFDGGAKGVKHSKSPAYSEHYKDLNSKPFFPKLIGYITSGPVVCMAWEGDGVVASARKLIGATNPLQAEPGTIRGDLAVQTGRNVVHGSDSPENGKREIALWFKEGELCEWTPAQAPWLLE